LKYFKKLSLVIHPFLLAVFFVLALYSANVNEVTPSEVVIPLVAAIGFALLVLLLALLLICLIRKLQKPSDSSQPYQLWDLKKAAIVASIFLVLFFTFGHALRAIGGWDDMHRTVGDPLYWFALSILYVALLTICTYLVVRASRNLSKLTVLLSIIATTLVMVSAVNIIVNEAKTAAKDTAGSGNIVDLAKPDVLPDIYYIVFDRYGSERTLKEVYDFDNSEFLNYLSDKGFYVANESRSNYGDTSHSLPSSLNMDFIHEEVVEEWTGSRSRNEMLQDYRIWRSLKSVGYEFIHFGSWWEPTRKNLYANLNINYIAIPEFSSYLFQTSWAYPWCLTVGIVDEWQETQYKRVIYKFDKLAEIPDMEEPTYVFAHMMIPHPPYVFNSDGSFLTPEDVTQSILAVQYVDQLIATNNMIRLLIDEILSRSEVPPIIILQADEGPKPERYLISGSAFDFEEATDTERRQKYEILNAYYLPNTDETVLYPSITPVNSFRLVFNLYFGTDYELLPDNSYDSNNDVTSELKYD
jgi:hypothetical protein